MLALPDFPVTDHGHASRRSPVAVLPDGAAGGDFAALVAAAHGNALPAAGNGLPSGLPAGGSGDGRTPGQEGQAQPVPADGAPGAGSEQTALPVAVLVGEPPAPAPQPPAPGGLPRAGTPPGTGAAAAAEAASEAAAGAAEKAMTAAPNPLPAVVGRVPGSGVDTRGAALEGALPADAATTATEVSRAIRQALDGPRGAEDAAVPRAPQAEARQALPAVAPPGVPAGAVPAEAAGTEAKPEPIPDTLLKAPPAPVASAPSSAPPPAGQASQTAMPGTPVPAPVEVPVNDPDWGNALGERVVWIAGQKIQSAEVRLNPAELGPLTVQVKVDDGVAQVSFTAQNALTREALEQALPRLREMFAQEGMTLGNADVGGEGVHDGRGGHGGAPDGDVAADFGADDVESALPVSRRAHDGLVDTFA